MPPAPPIVTCGEHEPLESAGPPPAPDIKAVTTSLQAADDYIDRLYQYVVKANGVIQRNAIRYHGVGSCLDADRQRGLIQ